MNKPFTHGDRGAGAGTAPNPSAGTNTVPIVYHPEYVTPLPDGHRFPMPKFSKVYELLQAEGLASPANTYSPDAADAALLSCVHTPGYIASFLNGTIDAKALRRIGLPWSEGLTRRTRRAVGGTLLTARLALEHGLACNTAGGTHHAHPGFGSGFCIFNDIAIAARTLVDEGNVSRVLIIDLDVHQGDGTAAAFAGDPRVFTFSMHCESNFPFRKTAGDRDVGLPDGMQDEEYLRCLEAELPPLIEQVQPELVIYDAGVDVYAGDRLGRLQVSLEGIYERDLYVLRECQRREVPVAGVIGGGYDHDLDALAHRHCMLHRTIVLSKAVAR